MELKYRIEDTDKLRRRFDPKQVDKAHRWAINAVSRRAATFISRDIRSVFAIKAGDIKRSLQIRKYRDNASRALLYTGGLIPLEEFKPKTKRKVIHATSKKGKKFKTSRRATTVRVRKDRGRRTVAGGFYAKGRVMRRREADRNDSTPIPMFGPSVPGMVAHPSTIDGAQNLVREELPEQFSKRLDYLLTKD